MKRFKVAILLVFLFNLSNLSAKTYPSGSVVPNVFDVCILLDKINQYGESHEEGFAKRGEIDHLLVTHVLQNIIKEEEAAIVSSPLMRALIIAASPTKQDHIAKRREYKAALDSLLDRQKWEIYLTNDFEFVVILPKSKYADTIDRADGHTTINFRKIGLDYGKLTLYEDDVDFYQDLSRQAKEMHEISIDTLLGVFYKGGPRTRKVNKRVYLVGHGSDYLNRESIANLEIVQYRSLRDRLDEVFCSFLYVVTCFGGSNVYQAQSGKFDEAALSAAHQLLPQQPVLQQQPARELSSKKFIEIAEGIPGKSVRGVKSGFNTFFSKVNGFLSHQMGAFRSVFAPLSGGYMGPTTSLDEALRNLTEQQMLSVKEFPQIPQVQVRPLIERVPRIWERSMFKQIFEGGIAGRYVQNIPSCRFPGSSDFVAIEGVIPNVSDQHIHYNDVRDLGAGDSVTIRRGITDVIINTTIVNHPIVIDATAELPRIHPSLQGKSHHYLKEVVMQFGDSPRPRLTRFIQENLIPNQPEHDKAVFISKLTFQGQHRSFSVRNVFMLKYARARHLKSLIYFVDNQSGKYQYVEFGQGETYDMVKTQYRIIEMPIEAEWTILKMMGYAKPAKYMGETMLQSNTVMFNGIRTITRFTQENLEAARQRTIASGNEYAYQFREEYIAYQLSQPPA